MYVLDDAVCRCQMAQNPHVQARDGRSARQNARRPAERRAQAGSCQCVVVYYGCQLAMLIHGVYQSMASAIQAAKASFASQRAGGASGRGEEESGRSKLEKTTKEKKPKVKAKPERFQQQQLSFVKPVTSFKSTEKGEAKRESLDSMSRRKPSRNDDKTDLKHKKPRLISLSSASAPSSQSVRGTHQSSSSKTERHIEKKQPTPPSSQSKYFASSSSQKAQYKSSNSSSSKTPHKKIPLRQFVDSVEEKKKSSLDMTLDEYLALDKAKKSQEQQLRSDDTGSNRTDKLSTGSSSSNASVSSKWERDRNKFRAKTQTENSSHGISSKWRIDSQSMGRWLTSGKSQQQQPKKSESTQSPPRGRGTSSPADHSHSGRTSLERPRVKFSGLRNGFSASTSAALSSRHQSPITRKDLDFLITPSTPEKRRKYQVRDDDDSDSADEQQKSARKRKRSSDFTSPVKRSTTPYKVLSGSVIRC